MTPAARVQTAIDLLDSVVHAAREQGPPADRILADWFRGHRFAGSKDRRAIRELVYAAIRACGPLPQSGRAAMLRLAEKNPDIAALFDDSLYGPAPIADGEIMAESGVAPRWLIARLEQSGVLETQARDLLGRAPLDIRVNALKADRSTLDLPDRGERLAAPQGLRFPAGTPIEQWPAFRDGLIEVQDGGSQLACEAVRAAPGETVIDLCAGAGGKTLALAASMKNQGVLIAADTDRSRLSRLAPRAERAGARITDTILLNPGRELDALSAWRGTADAVLIDAPCSGTGTWRRNPEARWRLTDTRLEGLRRTQEHLLSIAAELVRPGGRLVYVTCSLLDEEGADRMAAFLSAHPGWRPVRPPLPCGTARGTGTRLSPFTDGTDGFFIAGAEKP